MVTIHNLGFPRIGEQRELKFALEKYWRGELSAQQLREIGQQLRRRHWRLQQSAGLDLIPVNDFAFYDHMLDMSFLLNHIPSRFQHGIYQDKLDQYFGVARGHSNAGVPMQAGEMTKWFNTNYHYIVPELEPDTSFALMPDKVLGEIEEATALGIRVKPVLIGPLSYLWLAKTKSPHLDKLDLLDDLIAVYNKLLEKLVDTGITWVQLDEPILALDLPQSWKAVVGSTYAQLHNAQINTLLAAYFGPLQDNLSLVINLPIAGIHVDAVQGRAEVQFLVDQLPNDQVLSLGVIDGHNIWKTDLNGLLDWLEPLHVRLKGRLWLAPSCSLLHVPVNVELETALDADVHSWLAFAKQKLDELAVLATALDQGRASVQEQLAENTLALESRRTSQRVLDLTVRERLQQVTPTMKYRAQSYPQRAKHQKARFQLPLFPTTTIGSFPQTPEIRKARREVRNGVLSQAEYVDAMRQHIYEAIREQEAYGLDVLVHGEVERNDMVEYFGEQLAGYGFTQFGWVQSYGSRCVKPPIIYGDVSRPQPMTVSWSRYAQSLTQKPVKGMLTGPVTMLQWAFVRDDQPKSLTAMQIALALRDEVLDLEEAGITMIQVDEPAFREGLPLRKADWQAYLAWAGDAFRITTSGARADTQIHTHMCYSEFNDIINAIAMLDADVITIETSRSHMELLEAFTSFNYPNELGPGVYDIHSPNIPTVEGIITLVNAALSYIPVDRLWINPDCGLKTRQWPEVRSSLINMVKAAEQLRERTALIDLFQDGTD